MSYKLRLLRYGGAVVGAATAAASTFAIADTDGLVGTLDFSGLTANTASIVAQAFPVAAVAAGIALALGFLGWVVSQIRSGVRGRAK